MAWPRLRGSTLQLGRKAGAVPRNPGVRHRDLATKGPSVLREQWLVQIRGAEDRVFEPQSYREVGWIEMEGQDLPGHSSSSWKQEGGFGGARMEVTGDWRRGSRFYGCIAKERLLKQ